MSPQEPSPHSQFRYPADLVHEFVLFLRALLVVPNDAIVCLAVRIDSQRNRWNRKRHRMFVCRPHEPRKSNPLSNLLGFLLCWNSFASNDFVAASSLRLFSGRAFAFPTRNFFHKRSAVVQLIQLQAMSVQAGSSSALVVSKGAFSWKAH
jgi:hypothetical protein